MTRPDPFEADLLAALPRLHVFTRGLCRDADQADDLVQDTIERALKHRLNFVQGTNMRAWLYTIARNHFMTCRRKDWRLSQFPVGPDGVEIDILPPSPPNALDRVELAEVMRAMAHLPADQREALLMSIEGAAYEDIADETLTAVGTVKSRVTRGRLFLEQWFGVHNGRRDGHAEDA